MKNKPNRKLDDVMFFGWIGRLRSLQAKQYDKTLQKRANDIRMKRDADRQTIHSLSFDQ